MFTKKGIEVVLESTVKYNRSWRDHQRCRTVVPVDKLYIITGKIQSAKIIGNQFIYNCGGQVLDSSNRMRLSASIVKQLKLTHDSVLTWNCSYTSSGIKITLGVKL